MNPLEWIYYLGYRVDRWRGQVGVRRLPVPVVSLGNLTVGGTGKTPAAIALALEAHARGLNPVILTRGHGGRLRGPVEVFPDANPRDVGDEPLLMARLLGGRARVVKALDRYQGGTYALADMRPGPDVFILDDGYQHWRLGRDLDVLLVNGREPLLDQRLLPMGRLREPVPEMGRAGVVLVTKTDGMSPGWIDELVLRYAPGAPVYASMHRPAGIKDVRGNDVGDTGWVRGRRLYAFCGLGEPGAFYDSIEGLGGELVGRRGFGDHHWYTPTELGEMACQAEAAGAGWIITTEKDIMRMGDMGDAVPGNLVVLGMELEIPDRGFYDMVFGSLRGGHGDGTSER